MPIDTPEERAALLTVCDDTVQLLGPVVMNLPDSSLLSYTVRLRHMVRELPAALRRIDALEAENARLREALASTERDRDTYKLAHEFLWRRDGSCDLCAGDCDGPTSFPERQVAATGLVAWIHRDEDSTTIDSCGNELVHEALHEARAALAVRP